MTTYGGVDYSQYSSWQPYQLPDGSTYYVVPGTGWLYDPFTSSQTGKVQLFSRTSLENKQSAAERAKVEQDLKDKAVRLQLEQAKPMNQALQALVPIGGLLGGKYLVDALSSPATPTTPAGEGFFSGIGKAVSNLFGGSSPLAPTSTAATPLTSTAADLSSGLMQYGGTSSPLSLGVDTSLGNIGASAASSAPAETGMLSGLGGVLPAAGIAAGLYTGLSQLGGAKEALKGNKLSTTQQLALALPTFGASLLWNHIPGLTQKSTKEQEKERWGDLADKGVTGAKEAFLAAHGNEGTWSDGIGAGKEWNWEDAVARARANPSEFRGAYGNLKTFGNDWATYSPVEQDEIVKRLLDEGLYDPEKGDITITDEARARQIKDAVLAHDPATSIASTPKPSGLGTPPPSPFMLPNSSGVPAYFKNIGVAPSSSLQPAALPPAPPPSAPVVKNGTDIGKQLADRFNSKFGAIG